MNCPHCGGATAVTNTRMDKEGVEGSTKRRHRKCKECGITSISVEIWAGEKSRIFLSRYAARISAAQNKFLELRRDVENFGERLRSLEKERQKLATMNDKDLFGLTKEETK